MGRDGAPSCEASRVSSEDERIKEAEATIDGRISSIQTQIDLFNDAGRKLHMSGAGYVWEPNSGMQINIPQSKLHEVIEG
eukprot:2761949-Pyramimonas_sp.AAC.1